MVGKAKNLAKDTPADAGDRASQERKHLERALLGTLVDGLHNKTAKREHSADSHACQHWSSDAARSWPPVCFTCPAA